MGRAKPKPQPEAVILPPELDYDDDEESAGGGIPDDDGWVHLGRKEPEREDEKPKRRPGRRRA
jgi:hypothetical protein